MATRARSVLLRTAVAVLVTGGLAFVLLEASARVYLFGWAGLVPARVNSVHGLHQTGFLRPSSARRLGWELVPNVDALFKLVPFRTNSRGLRDREYALEKPAGTFRVAVVGASFALPAGVAIERAFHSLLEERLTREFAGLRFEFINFAVGMYAPEQVLAALELRALDYDPDLVLFTTTALSAPVMLDVPGSQRGRKKAPALAELPVFQKSYPVLQSFLWRVVEYRLGLLVDQKSRVGTLEEAFIQAAAFMWPEARPLKLGGSGQGPPVRSRVSVMDRLGRVRARSGIPIVVVRLEFDATDRRRLVRQPRGLAARCRALSLHCHDTREAFRGTRARDFWIHPLDPHPNALAHERFARSIAAYLAENGLLPGARETRAR